MPSVIKSGRYSEPRSHTCRSSELPAPPSSTKRVYSYDLAYKVIDPGLVDLVAMLHM